MTDGNNITTMVNCLETDLLRGPCSPNRLCTLVFYFETVPLLRAWCWLDVTFTGLFAHSIVSHWDLGCFHPQVDKWLYDFPSVRKSVQLALLLWVNIDTIRNCFLTLHMMTVIVWCFEFEKNINATNCLIREDPSLILNCQNSIWPACARVSPLTLAGWEDERHWEWGWRGGHNNEVAILAGCPYGGFRHKCSFRNRFPWMELVCMF